MPNQLNIFSSKARRYQPHESEHDIQVACVRWFRFAYRHYNRNLYAVPNGGARDAVTGKKLKDEGVVPGVADLCLDVARGEWHGLKIEMKTSIGKQSENQKLWQAAVESENYKYVVCHSFDDFVREIKAYLE